MEQKELPEGVAMRPLTMADVPAMAHLEQEIFTQEAWSEDTIAAELASLWTLYLGLFAERQELKAAAGENCGSKDATCESRELKAEPRDSQELIAYGGIKLLDEADLMVVAVSIAWQRRGLGRFLLRALHREAAACNIQRIILEVRASNTPAQRLYLAEGYRKINIIKNYYHQPLEDAWLMIKDL